MFPLCVLPFAARLLFFFCRTIFHQNRIPQLVEQPKSHIHEHTHAHTFACALSFLTPHHHHHWNSSPIFFSSQLFFFFLCVSYNRIQIKRHTQRPYECVWSAHMNTMLSTKTRRTTHVWWKKGKNVNSVFGHHWILCAVCAVEWECLMLAWD